MHSKLFLRIDWSLEPFELICVERNRAALLVAAASSSKIQGTMNYPFIQNSSETKPGQVTTTLHSLSNGNVRTVGLGDSV